MAVGCRGFDTEYDTLPSVIAAFEKKEGMNKFMQYDKSEESGETEEKPQEKFEQIPGRNGTLVLPPNGFA